MMIKKIMIFICIIITVHQSPIQAWFWSKKCEPKLDANRLALEYYGILVLKADKALLYLQDLVATTDNPVAQAAFEKIKKTAAIFKQGLKEDLEEDPPLEFIGDLYAAVNEIKASLLPEELRHKLYPTPEELNRTPYLHWILQGHAIPPSLRDLILKNHEKQTIEAIEKLRTCSDIEECKEQLQRIFAYWLYADFIRE